MEGRRLQARFPLPRVLEIEVSGFAQFNFVTRYAPISFGPICQIIFLNKNIIIAKVNIKTKRAKKIFGPFLNLCGSFLHG